MKTIGLIGGMSWQSSLEYYRVINEKVQQELGGLHSAKLILYSLDLEQIKILQYANRWEELNQIMIASARVLQKAGAELILIGSNTMHVTADSIYQNSTIPLVHIADATALSIQAQGLKKVGLLGTRFTMEQNFYKNRMSASYNLEVIIPNDADREIIHTIIYQELCLGKILLSSKNGYLKIIDKLIKAGAEGIVLGCTEIPLLISQTDISVPAFDTTRIHAEYAVWEAIKNVQKEKV